MAAYLSITFLFPKVRVFLVIRQFSRHLTVSHLLSLALTHIAIKPACRRTPQKNRTESCIAHSWIFLGNQGWPSPALTGNSSLNRKPSKKLVNHLTYRWFVARGQLRLCASLSKSNEYIQMSSGSGERKCLLARVSRLSHVVGQGTVRTQLTGTGDILDQTQGSQVWSVPSQVQQQAVLLQR